MPAQAFAWEASGVIEQLVDDAQLDVIEAPEFEAPLYFFQRRRAQGLGPVRTPPCVVHLHSPTDSIAAHNEWAVDDPLRTVSHHVERYSVRNADVVISPSRFLAREAGELFESDRSAEVIPYPMPITVPITRRDEVWARNTILFVGRLERRKGALEWLEAAVRVARDRPDASFVFVGENRLDEHNPGLALVYSRIPAELRSRFTFHEPRDRGGVQALLAETSLVIVPSRWENFPYTCIEAMASGVPVVVAPNGGTREMIDHGRTGWVADSGSAVDLARAATLALGTLPDLRATMGAAAAAAIGVMCAPNSIVRARHALYAPLLAAPIDRRGQGGGDEGARPEAEPALAPPRGALRSALGIMARHPVHTAQVLAGRIGRRIRTRLGWH